MNTSCVPGHELTKEPFRWDQRIFSLVMRLPGSVPIDLSSNSFIPSAENHPVDIMCEVTGGKFNVDDFVQAYNFVLEQNISFHLYYESVLLFFR